MVVKKPTRACCVEVDISHHHGGWKYPLYLIYHGSKKPPNHGSKKPPRAQGGRFFIQPGKENG